MPECIENIVNTLFFATFYFFSLLAIWVPSGKSLWEVFAVLGALFQIFEGLGDRVEI